MAFIIFAYPKPNNAVAGITRQETIEDGWLTLYINNKYKLCLDGTQIPSCIELGTFATKTEATWYLLNEILGHCTHYKYEVVHKSYSIDIDSFDIKMNTLGRYIVWSDKFSVPAYDKYNRKINTYFKGRVHFYIKEIG